MNEAFIVFITKIQWVICRLVVYSGFIEQKILKSERVAEWAIIVHNREGSIEDYEIPIYIVFIDKIIPDLSLVKGLMNLEKVILLWIAFENDNVRSI